MAAKRKERYCISCNENITLRKKNALYCKECSREVAIRKRDDMITRNREKLKELRSIFISSLTRNQLEKFADRNSHEAEFLDTINDKQKIVYRFLKHSIKKQSYVKKTRIEKLEKLIGEANGNTE